MTRIVVAQGQSLDGPRCINLRHRSPVDALKWREAPWAITRTRATKLKEVAGRRGCGGVGSKKTRTRRQERTSGEGKTPRAEKVGFIEKVDLVREV